MGCCQVLALTNKVPVNTDAQPFIIFISLGKMPIRAMARLYDKHTFILIRKLSCSFSRVAVTSFYAMSD